MPTSLVGRCRARFESRWRRGRLSSFFGVELSCMVATGRYPPREQNFETWTRNFALCLQWIRFRFFKNIFKKCGGKSNGITFLSCDLTSRWIDPAALWIQVGVSSQWELREVWSRVPVYRRYKCWTPDPRYRIAVQCFAVIFDLRSSVPKLELLAPRTDGLRELWQA